MFFILKTASEFPVCGAQCDELDRRRRRCRWEKQRERRAGERAALSSCQWRFTAECPAARSQVSRGDRGLESRGEYLRCSSGSAVASRIPPLFFVSRAFSLRPSAEGEVLVGAGCSLLF